MGVTEEISFPCANCGKRTAISHRSTFCQRTGEEVTSHWCCPGWCELDHPVALNADGRDALATVYVNPPGTPVDSPHPDVVGRLTLNAHYWVESRRQRVLGIYRRRQWYVGFTYNELGRFAGRDNITFLGPLQRESDARQICSQLLGIVKSTKQHIRAQREPIRRELLALLRANSRGDD